MPPRTFVTFVYPNFFNCLHACFERIPLWQITTISLSFGNFEKSEPRGMFLNCFALRALYSPGVRTSTKTLSLSLIIVLNCAVDILLTPFVGFIRQAKNTTIQIIITTLYIAHLLNELLYSTFLSIW